MPWWGLQTVSIPFSPIGPLREAACEIQVCFFLLCCVTLSKVRGLWEELVSSSARWKAKVLAQDWQRVTTQYSLDIIIYIRGPQLLDKSESWLCHL